jgi:hypothetical protein
MFPLAAEYLLYGACHYRFFRRMSPDRNAMVPGLYLALFGTGIFVLRQRKRPEYRLHLISMCFLFVLGSLSIVLDTVNRALSLGVALDPIFIERLDNHDSGLEKSATDELNLK